MAILYVMNKSWPAKFIMLKGLCSGMSVEHILGGLTNCVKQISTSFFPVVILNINQPVIMSDKCCCLFYVRL